MGAVFSTLVETRNAWVWYGKSKGKRLCEKHRGGNEVHTKIVLNLHGAILWAGSVQHWFTSMVGNLSTSLFIVHLYKGNLFDWGGWSDLGEI